MDINLLPKIFFRHHRALNMPARTSITPRRRPGRLPLFFRFPEHEIKRIFLLILSGYKQRTVACSQVIQIFVGKFSVIPETTGTKINGAIYVVGITFFDQRLDHINHAVDLLRRQRMRRRRFYIHALHVFFAFFDVALGDLLCAHTFFICLRNDLVIHIRKVGYVIDLIATIFHITAHRIKYDHRTGISDMDKIVNGRTAHIHPYLSRLKRDKFFFPFCLCIKNSHLLTYSPFLLAYAANTRLV